MQKERIKKKGKKKRIVLLVIVLFILIVAAITAYFSSHNEKIMNETVNDSLSVLSETYGVTEVPCGDYSEITVYGIMKFHVSQYEVEGLGNLCVMKMNAGLMQMATFVLTPYEKQMPMLSIDYVYTLGNRKAIVEFYDLVPDTDTEEYREILTQMQSVLGEFSNLSDYEPSSAWYDSLLTAAVHKEGKGSQDDLFSALFTQTVTAYTEASAKLPTLSEEEKSAKLEIICSYCDNMVENGGVSTNTFKKALGENSTRDFFQKVFFGTESASGR